MAQPETTGVRDCAQRAERCGYTAAHRREGVPTYRTNMTDVESELVADLFERAPGQRGTPVHYSRRELVNACSYVLRTGCVWRLLPTRSRPGKPFIKPSRVGPQQACSSRCKIGCASNGAHAWGGQMSRL